MHIEARAFLEKIKLLFPEYFTGKRIVDIGAGDVNGNNRYMFVDCDYTGVDVVPAPNVDIVSYAKDLPLTIGEFDVVVSSECFEHDMQIFQTLQRILRLVKAGGLFFFTCANIGRHEHGTKRTSPNCSYSVNLNTSDWYPNYYQNLSMDDICKMIRLQDYFSVVHFEYNTVSNDLYFYGIRNGNTNYESQNYLSNIFGKYKSDKNELQHNYTRQYDPLLSKFRYKNIKILEIGVHIAESLKAWRHAFPNAISVVGIDTNNSCKQYESIDMSMFIEIGDQSDSAFLNNLSSKYGPFDLIIDDGSHLNKDVICSFETLFPLLNNNGIYIIEDTVCFKVPMFVDYNYPNHLAYFTKYLPLLNQWNADYCTENYYVDPFKINKTTNDPFEFGIDKIEFGCSYIAVHKLNREHWKQNISNDENIVIKNDITNAINTIDTN